MSSEIHEAGHLLFIWFGEYILYSLEIWKKTFERLKMRAKRNNRLLRGEVKWLVPEIYAR